MIEGDSYVDKTLLIKDIILSKDDTILITRPRRWGKSVNLSMLYHFLNREVDNDGNPVEQNPNLVLFEGGNVLVKDNETKSLEPTKLAQDPLWETKLKVAQGSYPVIFMSLKSIKRRDYESFIKKMTEDMSRVYEPYVYLTDRLRRLSEDTQSIVTTEPYGHCCSTQAILHQTVQYSRITAKIRLQPGCVFQIQKFNRSLVLF